MSSFEKPTFFSKLGRCSICMRQSFTGTLVFWALFFVLAFFGKAGGAPGVLVLLVALAFLSLWLLHMIVLGVRKLLRK